MARLVHNHYVNTNDAITMEPQLGGFNRGRVEGTSLKLSQQTKQTEAGLMHQASRTVALMLIAVMLVAVPAILADPASSSGIAQASPPTMSTVNKVPDFYAEGKGDGYQMYMKLTPKGGYLTAGGTTVNLIPWGYVTADWSIGKVYIIFLANVTENDFQIVYLYLTNSSTPIAIRTFDYKYATLRTFMFTGIQYVFTRLTTTNSISMPPITFTPKAQAGNSLAALGPEIYINGNAGQVQNGTDRFKVFPLLQQYFQGADEYNELWSLLTDDYGGYYFSIFYMPNSDPNHVIMEHFVRLNDLKRFEGRTFDVIWTKGNFPYRLTIATPMQTIVKVNGLPLQTDVKGVVSIYVPKAKITVEVPSQLESAPGVRWQFSSWTGRGNSNPLTLDVKSSFELDANYVQQYLLTIDSPYGQVSGSGWHDVSTNATFSVPDVLTFENGTRAVFVRWEGDYSSTQSSGVIVMNSPKHLVAVWRTQFEVKTRLMGVPPNSTATVRLNDETIQVSDQPSSVWIDPNTEVKVEVETQQIQDALNTYTFSELLVDGQASSLVFIVSKPTTISFVYSLKPKSQSTITLNVVPSPAVVGEPVTLTGSLTPAGGSSTVNLFYGFDNVNWQLIASVSTDSGGQFSTIWRPTGAGMYYVKASWDGNDQYTAATRTISVRVDEPITTNIGSQITVPQYIQSILRDLNALPFISGLFGLAGALLKLGQALGNLFVPSGSVPLGYFIGSLLIGFVFIFPITAVLLCLKAARSRRPPSLVWLLPLFVIWLGALLLLFGNGALFVAPASLTEASGLLLIFSNALLMPLAFSVALARVVAT